MIHYRTTELMSRYGSLRVFCQVFVVIVTCGTMRMIILNEINNDWGFVCRDRGGGGGEGRGW